MQPAHTAAHFLIQQLLLVHQHNKFLILLLLLAVLGVLVCNGLYKRARELGELGRLHHKTVEPDGEVDQEHLRDDGDVPRWLGIHGQEHQVKAQRPRLQRADDRSDVSKNPRALFGRKRRWKANLPILGVFIFVLGHAHAEYARPFFAEVQAEASEGVEGRPVASDQGYCGELGCPPGGNHIPRVAEQHLHSDSGDRGYNSLSGCFQRFWPRIFRLQIFQ